MASTALTETRESQTVEKIVKRLNELVERHDLFIEAGKIVHEEIKALGKLEYGDQARIIRKVAEHPNLKYPPQRVKQAWITVSKFPKLLGQAPDLLDSSKYELLATSRLTVKEAENFEERAKKNNWSWRELKQAIGTHKVDTSQEHPDWLQYSNCWKFHSCDPRFGLDGHPGRIPGQITLNLLHLYTSKGELFISCFGGGGTDIDACKFMDRRCEAFDFNPVRKDIKKADLTKGIPVKDAIADFVFFDPPWLSAQKKKYSNHKEDFANLNFKEFYKRMDYLAQEAKRILKPNRHCAFIAANMPGWGQIKFENVGFNLFQTFIKYFEPVQRLSIPYPTNMIGGGGAAFQIARARKEKYLLAGFADLCIFKNRR